MHFGHVEPMFADRRDAGNKLGAALRQYQPEDPLILAIPRGGVPVGFEAARLLEADFDLLISRKLPFPDNPEAGFGAIAEDGNVYLIPEAEACVSRAALDQIIETQERVAAERREALRGGRPLPSLAGRTVVLVDDGIAMGSTMIAAVRCCRNEAAAKVIVATPVAGPRAARRMRQHADEVVVLYTPAGFRAVAEAYHHWRDLDDQDVRMLMESA